VRKRYDTVVDSVATRQEWEVEACYIEIRGVLAASYLQRDCFDFAKVCRFILLETLRPPAFILEF